VREADVLLALSNSGETAEVNATLPSATRLGAGVIAMTGRTDSAMAKLADCVLDIGRVQEACPLRLAPTASTSAMLALGDALALTVMEKRGFSGEQFATFHPGGSLGRQLMKVEEVMTFRPGEHLNFVSDALTLGDALGQAEATERRSGAMLLVDENQCLNGILTDADLRRVLVANHDRDIWSCPVAEFMTRNPKHVHRDDLASEALAILNQYRIDELPVLDEAGRVEGIIDVQDLLGIKTVTDDKD